MDKLSEDLDSLKKYVFYVFGTDVIRHKLYCYGRSKEEAYKKIQKIYPDLEISFLAEKK